VVSLDSVVETLFTQHDWNDKLSNYSSMNKMDNTYETITMEQDKTKTL